MRFSTMIAVCVLASACIDTSVDRLDYAVRPARPPDSVSLLTEEPQQLYTVIAVIESNGKSVFDSFKDLRHEMIAEAARLGGDAVILEPESTDSKFILTGVAMIKSDTKKLHGRVIVFRR